MPDALSLSRTDLPEEIEKAIDAFASAERAEARAMALAGAGPSSKDAERSDAAYEALTAAILSRLSAVEAALDAGLREAESLAVTLYKIHWREQAPNWQPLSDIPGLISQIDNMTAGMVKPEKLSAALARAERAEKELADIKAAEAAEVERITAEQRANSIAYLQANIAQMDRFMERGEEADPIGYMQWRDRRDRFQQELDAALTEARRLAIKDA